MLRQWKMMLDKIKQTLEAFLNWPRSFPEPQPDNLGFIDYRVVGQRKGIYRVPCPLCRLVSQLYYRHLEIVRCGRCGLVDVSDDTSTEPRAG